jgi:hypothetical protein
MTKDTSKIIDEQTGATYFIETLAIEDDPRNVAVVEDDTSKVCYITDYNLFSGSSDAFRNNVGGYFFNVINTSENVALAFSPFNKELVGSGDSYRPLNSYIDSIRSFRLEDEVEIPDQAEAQNKIIPNHKFVVSVDGKSDKIVNDEFWRVLWMGGVFNEVSYDAIFNNDAVYDDFYSAYKHPYGAMARQYLTNPEQVTNYLNITYNYNSYYENYQEYAATIENERLLPNIYLNTWANLYVTGAGNYSSNLANFMSYDEQILDPHTFFDNGDNIKIYLNQSASTLQISDATATWATKKFQNVFFNKNSYTEIYPSVVSDLFTGVSLDPDADDRSVLGVTGSYPYYARVSFDTETGGTIGGAIETATFSSRMLRLLKEVFTNEYSATKVPRATTQFSKNTNFLTSSSELEANTPISENTDVSLLGVDFFDLMLHSYKEIKNKSDNFIIIDDKNIETESAYDKVGAYRHLNTSNTLELMNNVLTLMQSETGVKDIESLLNIQRSSPETCSSFTGCPTALSQTPETKYSEVIAYRVEKSGVGLNNVIQNFWFFNASDLEDLNLFDTQVKYGAKYTYKVYEYRAIQGLKYKYSNLQLSRVIGLPNQEQIASEEGDPDYMPTYYCIEYYDPKSDIMTNDLLEASSYAGGGGLEGTSDDPLSSLASGAQRIAMSRGSGESKKPYFANFVVTTEPRLKIFEIPIMEKTVSIIDNPPNKLNILPSYLSGRQNTLQFELYYESFNKQAFPKTITSLDVALKSEYMFSNELLEDSEVLNETVSRHESIEVYRLDKMPASLRDFEGNMISSVPLRMDKSTNTYTGALFLDTIASNKKYYYVFRAVNENQVPGYMQEVVEAEYIDDGGYRYAVFNTLYEEDLNVHPFKETVKKTKKLFQITPAQRQLILDSQAADFNDTAAQALRDSTVQAGTAEDLIWNKTFKIRLTSRKTGKKLDLNVTYKQNNDILGS